VNRRPPILTIAGALLIWTGAMWIVYGPILPLLPPLVTQPISQVATVFGILAVLAGIGVLRVHPSARVLGSAVAVADLARGLVGQPVEMAAAAGRGLPDLAGVIVVGTLIPAVVGGFLVYALIVRWPSPETPAVEPSAEGRTGR
jgi:hypothetical protein